MAEDRNGKMEKCEMENFLINWEMSCKKKKKKKNWNRREADDCVFGSFMETVLYVFYDPIAVACSNFTLHINGVENI